MPAGLRFEAFVAQQRIQPDEPPAGLREALRLERETLAGIRIESVGDQQHDGVLREQASRPAPVELAQARADARAARPVGHGRSDAIECDVDVAVLQMPGDGRQPRAEQQRMDAVPIIRDRMQEVQQHARVAVHRARDVAEHDERRRFHDAAAERERRRCACRARHPPQAGAKIDARASPCRLRTPHRPFGHRQAQSRDHPS